MQGNDIFSIADFAKLSRTNRSTLLYYDKIGLLSPVSRRENNYRYYSNQQIIGVNLIRTCQALGMSIEEIKSLGKDRSPEKVSELLGRQIVQVDEKIDAWISARKLLTTLKSVIDPMLAADEKTIEIKYIPAEPIVLGGINNYHGGEDDYSALANFYIECSKKYPNLNLNYPVWGFFSEEQLKNNNWVWPERYYFYNPDGYDKRPAAYYAVGFMRGGYGKCGAMFEQLTAYIRDNGYEICGPGYTEYPLNELCYANDEDYLLRLLITVRKKDK